MAAILDHVLSSPEIQIQSYADRARTRMVLVVPDLLDLRVVDELMRITLDSLRIGPATVVDIGAQATSIAVVENGDVVDAARVLTGGDDVSDVLFDMMRRYKNPITRDVPEEAKDLDDYARGVPVNRRALVEQIKEGFSVIKVSEVYVREPGRVTEKFTVKMYDELYMAPLCLFYPWCIDLPTKLLALKRYSPLLVERTHPSRQMPLWTMDPPNKLGPHPWISWGCTDIPEKLEGHTGLEHRVAVTAQLMWLDELDRNKRHAKRRANGEVSEVGAFDEDANSQSSSNKKGKRGKRQAQKQVVTALGFPGISPPTGKETAEGDGDVDMRDSAETEDEGEESESDQQGPQLRRSRRANTPAITATDPVPAPSPAPPPAAPQLGNLPVHCSTLYSYTHTWVSPPLDQAIHALIANQRTDDRIRRNYSSILLVGGGARLPGFATKVLEPMLRTSMPARARTLAPAPGTAPETVVAVTLPPRDLDPRAVMWKGGTVLARLEVASEMWVSLGEWRAVGTASVVANKCGVVLPGSGVVGNLSGPAASLTMDPV
ncbi:hypothetical protein BCR44DRAFT_1500472 [Catenaria anguillulae PL171]|uniref:Uncharacterized protein n=1 Tax=Catenaria anguillulae PL171 TaxID=765915 RepID=A0A1Y2HKI8_9FUNG|nr:hypothetical protein BCR44DRAFT_1500472 [Catenaria anguillulae PL171]